MTTIRRHPTVTAYSPAYQTDLRRATTEILIALHWRAIPLEQLVWQARAAYQRAWAAEMERPNVG